ncbi:adenine phosphoribosyltransferase [Branchiibius cervicis]|uniref:Adenine phosphoribosyltransferase n=1 Tax=Branchiibius cervicis TaxID=908252 RepID=A0ABW2ART9_9MICO
MVEELILEHTRDVADFPEPGVQFKDLTPLFAAPEAFRSVVDDIGSRYRAAVDVVVGIEARGFILAAPVAMAMDLPFVPVRKAGKLPGPTLRQEYSLEYGTATIEVHSDSLAAGQRVLLLDDVLATGGTAAAAASLIERTGARVAAIEMLMELGFLGGRAKLAGYDVNAIVSV